MLMIIIKDFIGNQHNFHIFVNILKFQKSLFMLGLKNDFDKHGAREKKKKKTEIGLVNPTRW